MGCSGGPWKQGGSARTRPGDGPETRGAGSRIPAAGRAHRIHLVAEHAPALEGPRRPGHMSGGMDDLAPVGPPRGDARGRAGRGDGVGAAWLAAGTKARSIACGAGTLAGFRDEYLRHGERRSLIAGTGARSGPRGSFAGAILAIDVLAAAGGMGGWVVVAVAQERIPVAGSPGRVLGAAAGRG